MDYVVKIIGLCSEDNDYLIIYYVLTDYLIIYYMFVAVKV